MIDIQQKQQVVSELRQEQTMTHQQIQALEMLSVPVLELETMVNQELESNPVLDTEGETEDIPAKLDDDEWLDLILKLDENRRFLQSNTKYVNPEDEEKRQHYLESVTYQVSLHESLYDQLRFLDVDEDENKLCELIIAGLDDDGYLTSHLADLAMAAAVSLEKVEKAMYTIQQFEPAGVAARDIRERLMLQLERMNQKDTLVYTAVKDYLDEIASNHLPLVARKLKISMTKLHEVIHDIQCLSPRLEKGEVSPHEYIEEEVTVYEKNNSLEIQMNNG